jgi:hypothetical protein
MRLLTSGFLLLILGAVFPCGRAAAESGVRLGLSAGAYDVGGYTYDTAEAGIELQLPPVWQARLPRGLSLRPMLGLSGTSDEAAWIYAGLRADVETGSRWVVSPSFAVALFDEGEGKDLGGAVEFRSAIEGSYRLGAGARIGLTFHHLSNGGLYDHNPGSNSLLLVYTLALVGP